MKKLIVFIPLVCLAIGLWAQSPTEKIAPELLAALDRGETADALIIFQDKADLRNAQSLATKTEKARFVFARLQETAARSQTNALRMAREHGTPVNSLFLVNALALEKADADLLHQLAALTEVKSIEADPWVKFPEPMQSLGNTNERNTVEWGIAKIKAPEVWALGYTGQGITVGGADTGYDWTHPALQTKYRGWTGDIATSQHNYNWHDAIHEFSPLNNDTLGNPGTNPCGLDAPQPCDDSNHGTHTMGTMTGDDGLGNQIGVAPGARWIGCRNMERGWGKPSSYIECFQWFLAPTDLGGQNPDPARAPHVINNSWYCSPEEGCTGISVDELLRTAVVNLKTAGVVVVASNGNFGPSCATAVVPAYFEESFAVGATNSEDFIAPFSSRGPATADGSNRIKPNVSAPGVDVRSSIRNGQYANFNGTSMAGPHVVGLVALVLSANPALAGHVDDIEDIVEQTSIFYADTLDCGANSLGGARPNHAYGWGRVDALGAVVAALLWSPPVGTGSPEMPVALAAPNPVHDAAIFEFENLRGKAVLEIFSPSGQLVFSKNWSADGRETLRVSMANLPVGVYFWKLKNEVGAVSGSLVKA